MLSYWADNINVVFFFHRFEYDNLCIGRWRIEVARFPSFFLLQKSLDDRHDMFLIREHVSKPCWLCSIVLILYYFVYDFFIWSTHVWHVFVTVDGGEGELTETKSNGQYSSS